MREPYNVGNGYVLNEPHATELTALFTTNPHLFAKEEKLLSEGERAQLHIQLMHAMDIIIKYAVPTDLVVKPAAPTVAEKPKHTLFEKFLMAVLPNRTHFPRPPVKPAAEQYDKELYALLMLSIVYRGDNYSDNSQDYQRFVGYTPVAPIASATSEFLKRNANNIEPETAQIIYAAVRLAHQHEISLRLLSGSNVTTDEVISSLNQLAVIADDCANHSRRADSYMWSVSHYDNYHTDKAASAVYRSYPLQYAKEGSQLLLHLFATLANERLKTNTDYAMLPRGAASDSLIESTRLIASKEARQIAVKLAASKNSLTTILPAFSGIRAFSTYSEPSAAAAASGECAAATKFHSGP